VDRPLHGMMRCGSRIEAFNLSRRSRTQPIGYRRTTNDRLKVLTLVTRQRLGVTNTADELAIWHEDCARNNRPG
jgi:hypothetical protein